MTSHYHICFFVLVSLGNWNGTFTSARQVEEAMAGMFELHLKCFCSATSQNVQFQKEVGWGSWGGWVGGFRANPRENNRWKKTRCYLWATRGKCACYQLQSLRRGQEILMVAFTAGPQRPIFLLPHLVSFVVALKIPEPPADFGEDKQQGVNQARKESPMKLPGHARGCNIFLLTWRMFIQHLIRFILKDWTLYIRKLFASLN